MYHTTIDKISWCLDQVNEFIDLIEINDSNTELGKRYSLINNISGKNILYRYENLIVSCWSAKDWIKKDICSKINEIQSVAFEKKIFDSETTHLMQYLADSIKHGGIDENRLKTNRFKQLKPRLGKTILILTNNSVPGPFKPRFETKGDNVPSFAIEQIMTSINGKVYYDFDTITLSVEIIDKNGKVVGLAIDLINKYIDLLNDEYKKLGLQ